MDSHIENSNNWRSSSVGIFKQSAKQDVRYIYTAKPNDVTRAVRLPVLYIAAVPQFTV